MTDIRGPRTVANPDKPEIDYSYTGFQQAQGSNSFPGTQLDNDLAELKRSIDETIDFVTPIIREDGRLQNGVVTKNALAADVVLGLEAPRPWASGTVYKKDQTATTLNSLYVCLVDHVAGSTFSTDLGAGRWALVIEFTVAAAIPDNAVTTTKIADNAVTTAKIANTAISTAKIANLAVSKAKLAADVGVVPIGASMVFDGVIAPSGWLFKYGQSVSRSTYSALFDVLCPPFTASVTSGSNTLTSVSVDFRNLGIEGVAIECAGVPVGTVVQSVTATTIVMSVAATATAGSATGRVLPWGASDLLTFRLPDVRDRAGIARGNMGGTAADRVTATGAGSAGVNTSRLGTAGGVDRHALTTAQLPAHGHPTTVTLTDNGHAHFGGQAATYPNAGGNNVPNPEGIPRAGVTSIGLTGITVAVTVNNTGGNEAHTNMPPFIVRNEIIYAGV